MTDFSDDWDDEKRDFSNEFALSRDGFKRLWEEPTERAVKWLFEKYIPRGSLVVLVGESGIGKSTLAMDLSVAAVTATPFAGHEYASSVIDQSHPSDGSDTYTVQPSNAVYLYGEGSASQVTRFAAAYEARKIELYHAYARSFAYTDMYKLPIFRKELMCTNEGYNSLRSHIERMKASKDYESMVAATGLSHSLIVVDTLIAVSGIPSENESGSMQNCINFLKELGREFNATVLVIVHPKKGTSEIRGSSALYNAADVVLRIERQPQTKDILHLVQDKARHGPKQSPKRFRLIPFAGDPSTVGGGIMPPVIEWLDEDERIHPQIISRAKRDESVKIKVQREHMQNESDASGYAVYKEAVSLAVMGQGKPDAANFTWTTPDAIRGEFDRIYQRNAEANRKAFERAHKRAVGEGKVVVSTVGDGRQLVRIVE